MENVGILQTCHKFVLPLTMLVFATITTHEQVIFFYILSKLPWCTGAPVGTMTQ